MTNLYQAGTISSNFNRVGGRLYAQLTERERAMRDYNKYYLESYHYIDKESYVKRIRNDGIRVFLDSGAYTAFTKGTKIDLQRYIDYCHRNADIIEMISVLDEINFENTAQAVKVTFKNLQEMEKQKLKGILPTYHFGEPTEVIEYYAAHYPYLSLGGLVGAHPKQLMLWLDDIWGKYLTNPDGTAKVKVHGFGLTSLPIMTRYPWYSVDSSTWVQWAANGMILLPENHAGQINISSRSSFRKVKGQHLSTLSPIERQVLEDEIVRLGGDVERIATLYYVRWAWNYYAFPRYIELRAHLNKSFIREYEGLF